VAASRGRLKGRKEELLFCEQKRSKKNFASLDRAGVTARGPTSESFLLLFFKKEALSCLTCLAFRKWRNG
jgi:hypothetical protein